LVGGLALADVALHDVPLHDVAHHDVVLGDVALVDVALGLALVVAAATVGLGGFWQKTSWCSPLHFRHPLVLGHSRLVL
jgi:hypothetical protein